MKALEGEILNLHFQQRYFCWLLPYHYWVILMSIFKEMTMNQHLPPSRRDVQTEFGWVGCTDPILLLQSRTGSGWMDGGSSIGSRLGARWSLPKDQCSHPCVSQPAAAPTKGRHQPSSLFRGLWPAQRKFHPNSSNIPPCCPCASEGGCWSCPRTRLSVSLHFPHTTRTLQNSLTFLPRGRNQRCLSAQTLVP